jgi:hypothetical protein
LSLTSRPVFQYDFFLSNITRKYFSRIKPDEVGEEKNPTRKRVNTTVSDNGRNSTKSGAMQRVFHYCICKLDEEEERRKKSTQTIGLRRRIETSSKRKK